MVPGGGRRTLGGLLTAGALGTVVAILACPAPRFEAVPDAWSATDAAAAPAGGKGTSGRAPGRDPGPTFRPDPKQLAALRAELAARPSPEVAGALGHLLSMAGDEAEAARQFARAASLLSAAGATPRLEVVKSFAVSGLAWQGDTLALTRGLQSLRQPYQSAGTRLEIWPQQKGRFPAPSLLVSLATGGHGVAWAGAGQLWWHGGAQVALLEAGTGRILRTLATGAPDPRRGVRFAHAVAVAERTGHVAAVTGLATVRVWSGAGALRREVTLAGHTMTTVRANMGTHCEMRTVRVPVEAHSVALSPDGRWLAIAANDDQVRLVSVAGGRVRTLKQAYEQMHYGPPRNPFWRGRALRLRFAQGGRRLVLLQADSSVTTWDVVSGRRLSRVQVPCPEASEAGARARLARERRSVSKWSLLAAQRDAREGCFNVRAGDLTADGRRLATAKARVSLYGLPGGAERPGPKVPYASELAFDPRGRRLAAAGTYRGAGVWDLASSRRLADLTRPTVSGEVVDLSRDGRLVAIWHPEESWTRDGEVSLWDLTKGARLGTVRAWSSEGARLTGDGRVLVAGVKDRVEAHTVGAPGPARELLRGVGYGGLLEVAPRGSLAAVSGFKDQKVRLVDVASGRVSVLAEAAAASQLRFDGSGRFLAAAAPDGARIWDARTGRLLRRVAPATAPAPVYSYRRFRRGPGPGAPRLVTVPPKAVAVSHDGRFLAYSEAYRRTVRIVEIASGRERASLTTAYDAEDLRFLPKGDVLAVGGIGVLGLWRFTAPGPATLDALRAGTRPAYGRRLVVARGGRALVAFGYDHRLAMIWSLPGRKLLASLWPATGGHWVALSERGFVDASPVGREALVTYARPAPGAPEVGYGWGVGWSRLRRAGLVSAALAGRPILR